MNRIRLLNAEIDNLTMEETVSAVEDYLRHGRPLHLIGVNADKINEMYRDADMQRLVNACGIVNADGHSMLWASRVLRRPLKERVAGIDLMQELVALAARQGYRVYLLGAKQPVVEQTAGVLQRTHPELKLVGFRNGYFSDDELGEISRAIADCGAQLVFVGISSPRKERIIAQLQAMGHRCVFMGVGGSFDVLSGTLPRAPLWMQRHGLEWLFRMMQEPGRLWKRYLVGNSRFMIRVYRERFFGSPEENRQRK